MVRTDEKAMRNVGTGNRPVSWLHQYAVALLYDELDRDRGRLALSESWYVDSIHEVRVRLTPGGDFSHNLREGVSSVHLPGEWDNVGGVVPDLICRDDQGNPIRIIEVIVTSPPDASKRQKLDNLKKRGVDVVEVTVRTEKDLRHLCWVPVKPVWAVNTRTRMNDPIPPALINKEADNRIVKLIRDLTQCSPALRRQFLDVCSQLHSLDSLSPIRSDNPLKDELAKSDVD